VILSTLWEPHAVDLSRIARSYTDARGGSNNGRFSLTLWTYIDKNGRECRDPNRPCIVVKHIDSKRALISLTSRKSLDSEDRIPEGSKTGKPEEKYNFRGNFLDLRTLAFALTDRGFSLESACEAFEVEHRKKKTSRHG
jgi:hypothetical protein